MDKKKNQIISTGHNGGAAFFAAMVIVSMFITYVTVDLLLVKTTTTGFELLDYNGAIGRPFLVISMILSMGILAFSVLRLIRFPLFNARLFSMIYAIAGAVLMVVSIVLMITVVKVKVGDSTVEIFERGIGVILNLVFSIIVAICCIGSCISTGNS